MMPQAQALLRAGIVLPELPDKLFYTIREVSDTCGVEPHVLRYWESEFAHIRPVKRSGNRRFYRQQDVYTILFIKHLLYDLKFTIKGARKRLLSGDSEPVSGNNTALAKLQALRQELLAVRDLLDD